MINELIYILTGCAMLGVLYVFTALNISKKSKTTTPKPGTQQPAAASEQPLAYFLTAKLEQIFKRMDTIHVSNISSLKEAVKSIKQNMSDFDGEVALKLTSARDTKDILHSMVTRIKQKIDDLIKNFENEIKLLENQKKMAEKELIEHKKQAQENLADSQSEVQKLVEYVNTLKKEYVMVNIEELKKEIEPLIGEAEELSLKYKTASEKDRETLAERDAMVEAIRGETVTALKEAEFEKIQRILKMKGLRDSLENELTELKRLTLKEQERHRAETEKINQEIISAKEYVEQIEENKRTAEKLIAEREELQKKLGELKYELSQQEETYLKELAKRNEEIEKLQSSADEKIKEIEAARKEEEIKHESEKKILDDEILRLKNQIEKSAQGNRQAIEKLQGELCSLKEINQKKEAEYSDLNKERIEKERNIKDFLIRQISEYEKNIKTTVEKLEAMVKSKSDEIYTLKIRLSAREDKLKTDLERCRETGKEILEELTHSSEDLMNRYQKESEAVKLRIKPLIEQVENTKQTISTLDNMIFQEQIISEKLEEERKRIGNEIETVENKIEQDIIEARRLAELKNRYVERLAKEIIEKERLFSIERKARQQILQGKYVAGKTEYSAKSKIKV